MTITVGSNRNTDATAADQDTPVLSLIHQSLGHSRSNIRIIHGGFGMGSQIGDAVALLG